MMIYSQPILGRGTFDQRPRLSPEFVYAACTFMLLLQLGCDSQNLSEAKVPVDAPSMLSIPNKPEINTIPVSVQATTVSPANHSQPVGTLHTPPETICQLFLQYLNRQDSDEFELLLSPAALNTFTRLNFQLPPVAEPNTRFNLSSPRYNSIREEICYIDCQWLDHDPDDDLESPLTVMLRNTKSGWRVAGMIVAGERPDTIKLLSFENTADVQQIKDSIDLIDIPLFEQNVD